MDLKASGSFDSLCRMSFKPKYSFLIFFRSEGKLNAAEAIKSSGGTLDLILGTELIGFPLPLVNKGRGAMEGGRRRRRGDY